MIKEAPGVSGVKLEGGKEIIPQVSKITSAGIPVFCQVGITPQRTIQTANDEEGTGRSEVSVSTPSVYLVSTGKGCLWMELG